MAELKSMSVLSLLRLHSSILEELRNQKILRTRNGPAGDYGEILFSRAFNWPLNNNSSLGYDATDKNGTRYEIKCRHLEKVNSSRQLSDFRNLPDNRFDFLAGVLLKYDFHILKAALIPFRIAQKIATFSTTTKAWRIVLRDSIWNIEGVIDVTSNLKVVEEAFSDSVKY